MIENLTKQKQTIIDRKNELVENTLKNGGKVDDIKDQLKTTESSWPTWINR